MVPTRRRTLAAASALLVGSLAGCQAPGDPGRDAPDYDCADAARPPPATVGDATDPTAASRYPDPPADPGDTDAVAAFVTAHERAFRRNGLAREYGDRLKTVGVSPGGTRSFDAPDGASVVRLRYHYYYETASEEAGADGTPTRIHADSATTWATYYVDGEVAVRAETTGPLDDESALVPDPWTEGEPVVCFE
jgi:hypothetical protein